tara:strand:- start:923 stop:1138 length:216 start_codon:yes stop_codon:yes gene_type:complete
MGEETHTEKGEGTGTQDEKVDLRKHRKRITTPEELQEIYDNRKKYKEEDLKQKMERISEQQIEDGRIIGEG